MSRCWILVGMMGAGKTSVARELGSLTGREVLDTDQLIQQRFGRSVSQVFQVYGEEAFRDHETSILRTLQPHPCVLATGGGIVVREQNWIELRRLGITAYLEADAETLADRLLRSRRRRPLLDTEQWQEKLAAILESRRERYERADLRSQLGGHTVQEVAADLLRQFRAREEGS